jgi:hypothetical protein
LVKQLHLISKASSFCTESWIGPVLLSTQL